MSGRKNTNVYQLEFDGLPDGDMSTSFTSEPTNVLGQDNVGIQVVWDSEDAIGTISVECSNNYDPVHLTGTWVALTFSPELTQPNEDSGEYLININQVPFQWIRLAYEADSGEGALQAWLSSKMI